MPPRDELLRLYFRELHTYESIGKIFGVSIPTVSKWFKLYKINPKLKYDIITIKGVQHKRCFGPAHPKGGELLPVSRFHRNVGKKSGYASRCAACVHGRQKVKFDQYQAWVQSIYRRLGYMETTRRLEIAERTLTQWLGKDRKRPAPQMIFRHHAVRIASLMLELRETNEVRHRDSIHRGAKVRGEIEKPVTGPRDLLVPHGDYDTEWKRQRRKSNPEIRERERERKRQERLRKRQAA